VIKLEIGDTDAWRHFVDDSAKLGNPPDLPMQLLDGLVHKTPQDKYTLRSACRVRAMLNQQLDVALTDCDAALRLDSNQSWGFLARCLVRYRKGEYALAVADCDEALRQDPKLSNALYIRGLVNLRMGHAELANADIAAAKAIDPAIADEYTGFGLVP
jgi:tetratricopeptide (TPR) repeat protein